MCLWNPHTHTNTLNPQLLYMYTCEQHIFSIPLSSSIILLCIAVCCCILISFIFFPGPGLLVDSYWHVARHLIVDGMHWISWSFTVASHLEAGHPAGASPELWFDLHSIFTFPESFGYLMVFLLAVFICFHSNYFQILYGPEEDQHAAFSRTCATLEHLLLGFHQPIPKFGQIKSI